MPEYRVAFKASAEKELLRLPDAILGRVIARVERLAGEPRPRGSKKLRGAVDLWRIRIGDYRVVYAVDDTRRSVEVMRVAHRREVYE